MSKEKGEKMRGRFKFYLFFSTSAHQLGNRERVSNEVH